MSLDPLILASFVCSELMCDCVLFFLLRNKLSFSSFYYTPRCSFLRRGVRERERENISASRTSGHNILDARPGSCNDSFANHYEEKSSNGESAGNDSSARIGANDGSDSLASRFRGNFFRRIDASSVYERYNSCLRNKSRIFGDIAAGRRDCTIAMIDEEGICIKGIPSYRKNCEGFLNQLSLSNNISNNNLPHRWSFRCCRE